jgi:hypothetical protein
VICGLGREGGGAVQLRRPAAACSCGHPPRALRVLVNEALRRLERAFAVRSSGLGWRSIVPEPLLPAMPLLAFYAIRLQLQLTEREFVGRGLDLSACQRGATRDFSRPGRPTDNGFSLLSYKIRIKRFNDGIHDLAPVQENYEIENISNWSHLTPKPYILTRRQTNS